MAAFTSLGGAGKATFTWTPPTIGDLDQYIVRMTPGTTPPTTPTGGTHGYTGTTTTATITGLTTTQTYAYTAWTRDRAGTLSPPTTGTLTGVTITNTPANTTITTGTTITFTATLTRTGTGPWTNQSITLYAHRKGTSTWIPITTQTTDNTGQATYTVKPSIDMYYRWSTTGNPTTFAANSPTTIITVTTKTPPQPGGR